MFFICKECGLIENVTKGVERDFKRGYQKGYRAGVKGTTKKYYKNLTECARLEKQMKYGVRIEEDPEGSYGQTGIKKGGEIK